ncbi:MAG: thiamine pyrophosphate-dependent enzyme [Dehalococcoidia bacterium]|nr:thiamine pyrophosphate-dependent enzyme [Dehalococcoidia bacterium]
MIKEKVYGVPKYGVAYPGLLCPGCGHGIVRHMIAEVLEEMDLGEKAIHVGGMGCTGYVTFTLRLDQMSCTHGTGPALATGVKRGLNGKPFVFTYQGDGDAMAIGAGALINAAARGEKITVIMGNNANYGTTGGQMAPTTLIGQKTTTTPMGRDPELHGYPQRTAELLATIEGVAYSARGSVSSPANYQKVKKMLKTAFQKQLDGEGLSFLEILVACPTDWKKTPAESLKWIDEVLTKTYPLGEIKNISRKK